MRVNTLADIGDAEREAFLRDGFGVVERLVDAPVLKELRQAYDDIIERRVQARGDRMLGDVIRQVKHPAKDHLVFAENPALEQGERLIEVLFGPGEHGKTFDMLIDKPGGTPHETPWHQDAGYYGNPVAPPGTFTEFADITIWLALDDADAHKGCMQFLSRPHGTPTWAHKVVSGDPTDEGRLIGFDEPVDLSGAVTCAIRAGGCTIHLPGTPHRTGPNLTDRPRRAYIFNFGPASFAQVAEQQLREAWGESARL